MRKSKKESPSYAVSIKPRGIPAPIYAFSTRGVSENLLPSLQLTESGSKPHRQRLVITKDVRSILRCRLLKP